MNRKTFLKILQNPSRLENNHVFELEDIIKNFPYFQAARVLHLKGLKIQDSFRYNQSLKTTAIHTTDRSVLFHFITSDIFHESQSNKEEQDIIEEIEQVDKNVLENIKKEEIIESTENDILDILEIERFEDQIDDIEEKGYDEIESDLIPTDPTLDTSNKKTDDFLITEEEIEGIDASFEEMTDDVFEENNLSELIDDKEDTIIEPSFEEEIEGVDASFEEMTDDVFEENNLSELVDDKEGTIIEPSFEKEKAKSFSFEIDPKDTIETVETHTQDEVSTKTTKDYSINFEPANEYNTSSDKKETTHVESEGISFDLDIEKPIHFKKDDTHSFSEWMQLSSFKPIDRSNTSDSTREQTKKMDIIDEFIENNPKISPIKKTDFSVNFNQIEEVESDVVMTETLARVYTEQHKYESAIKAYEVLSLKFPEKSGFFADQIQKIEELKKTN